MRRPILAAPLFLAVALATPDLVRAQSLCFPAELLAQSLERQHGERLVGRSVTSSGSILEHWEDRSSDGDGSWTMVILTPDGRRCPVAAGHFWERVSSSPEGEAAWL